MNETDKEIIAILKETFRKRRSDELVDPDDLLRAHILKTLLVMSVIGFALVIILKASGKDASVLGSMISSIVGIFFGVLFLHINGKSKNPSIITWGLTWISMVIALYVGN